MTVWFTADTHFGHANIIRSNNRPFSTSNEMDVELMRRWNERVTAEDVVYHLGDFSFAKQNRYLPYLKGRKHLIKGNHDPKRSEDYAEGWESISDMLQVSINGIPIVLCHYGMRVWNKSHHGALHFFGHSHGNLSGNSQSCDVGVDCWDYRPITLTEIQRRLKTFPAYRHKDHHQPKVIAHD